MDAFPPDQLPLGVSCPAPHSTPLPVVPLSRNLPPPKQRRTATATRWWHSRAPRACTRRTARCPPARSATCACPLPASASTTQASRAPPPKVRGYGPKARARAQRRVALCSCAQGQHQRARRPALQSAATAPRPPRHGPPRPHTGAPLPLPRRRNSACAAMLPQLPSFEPSALADTLYTYGLAQHFDFELMTVRQRAAPAAWLLDCLFDDACFSVICAHSHVRSFTNTRMRACTTRLAGPAPGTTAASPCPLGSVAGCADPPSRRVCPSSRPLAPLLLAPPPGGGVAPQGPRGPIRRPQPRQGGARQPGPTWMGQPRVPATRCLA